MSHAYATYYYIKFGENAQQRAGGRWLDDDDDLASSRSYFFSWLTLRERDVEKRSSLSAMAGVFSMMANKHQLIVACVLGRENEARRASVSSSRG